LARFYSSILSAGITAVLRTRSSPERRAVRFATAALSPQVDIDDLLGSLDIALEDVEPAFELSCLSSHVFFRFADTSELVNSCDMKPSALLIVHANSIDSGSQSRIRSNPQAPCADDRGMLVGCNAAARPTGRLRARSGGASCDQGEATGDRFPRGRAIMSQWRPVPDT
jgi:hypothetical protein